jgi:hypothetical protein
MATTSLSGDFSTPVAASKQPAATATKPNSKLSICELTGVWGVLFRLALMSHPFILAWAVWVTTETFRSIAFRESSPFVTEREQTSFRLEMLEKIASQPPPEWRTRVSNLEHKNNEVVEGLIVLKATIEANRATLERIEKKLEAHKGN